MARGRKEARLLARLTGTLAVEADAEEDDTVAEVGLLVTTLLAGVLLALCVVWRYLQSLPKKQRPCDTQ